MTDPYEPTTTYSQPGYVSPAPVPPASARPEPVAGPGLAERRSPGADIKPEEPRRHPVAYLSLVLSLIALLWLAVTSGSGSDGYQKVRVGTQDCVSVPQDSGPAALYCRTPGTPGK